MTPCEWGAKVVFEQALKDEVQCEGIMGEIFYSKSPWPVLDEDKAQKGVKPTSLEDRVSGLTYSLNAYKLYKKNPLNHPEIAGVCLFYNQLQQLRNRFINTPKRDKLASATDAIIGVGQRMDMGAMLPSVPHCTVHIPWRKTRCFCL